MDQVSFSSGDGLEGTWQPDGLLGHHNVASSVRETWSPFRGCQPGSGGPCKPSRGGPVLFNPGDLTVGCPREGHKQDKTPRTTHHIEMYTEPNLLKGRFNRSPICNPAPSLRPGTVPEGPDPGPLVLSGEGEGPCGAGQASSGSPHLPTSRSALPSGFLLCPLEGLGPPVLANAVHPHCPHERGEIFP